MARTKAGAYHGIANAQYAARGADGEIGSVIKKFPYTKSITLNAVFDNTLIHADDKMILAIPSDQGYEGTLSTTDQDIDFELDAGLVMELASGIGNVKMTSYGRIDLYYEFKRKPEKGKEYAVKVWALNCEVGKPNINSETDTNTPTIGAYEYPLRVYGERVMDDSGTAPYKDDLGNERDCFMYISVPGDIDYADFEKTVPVPKIAAVTP